MQLLVTLRSRDAPDRDVELRAPAGATVGEIAPLLHGTTGLFSRPANHVDDGTVSARSGLWIGSRALPWPAPLAKVGLHSGSFLGIGEPAPRIRPPLAAVRLHVVSGPDAGRVEPIARGRLRIGRDATCQVRLSDPDVSRHHAELVVRPSGVVVRDLGSSNGTSILSASAGPIAVDADGSELPVDSYLTLGETTLCIAGVRTPPAATTTDGDGRILVNRSPRLDPSAPDHLDLPPDPSSERGPAVPWIAALIPALGGVALAVFLHSPQFLAFALLSPLILLATALSDRMSGSRLRGRTRVAAARQRKAATEARSASADEEVAFRRRAHPDPAASFVTATTPDARLWERRRTDADFLEVRLGLGPAPARVVTRIGTDVLTPVVLPGVPAVVSLRSGPLGICGPRPLALPMVRWVVGQLAILHSPADLRLAALLSEGVSGDWEWLRWLPHIRASTGGLRIARTPQDRQRLVGELSARVDVSAAAAQPPAAGQAWTVVLVDRCSSVAEARALVGDPARFAATAITFVYVDAEARQLPAACVLTAQLSGETGTRVRIRTRGSQSQQPGPSANSGPTVRRTPNDRGGAAVTRVGDPVADRVSEQWCDDVARALAPLSDPGAEQAHDLPVSVRARDLYDLPDLAPMTIRARWDRARGRAATPVGIGLDGTVEIDLGRDGPHALVAGTTGAGKSEFLQALVAGLAVHSPPAELQFVLIDYKGGAAFGECSRLPHTVGMVTDLDPHLTQRALRSLEAELRRREAIFAHAGAIDLDAYRGSPDQTREPVGRIVLVVDEFASLAEELPEFVTGLVGIAQRGRSLGVHLILATQRPSGVVSAEIRANTALRVALRVTDLNDSSDVIGSDLAAHIDQHLPGRAVIRAAQSLFPVQIGRISMPSAEHNSRVEVIPLDRWGTPVATSAVGTDAGRPRRSDLQELVTALDAAWVEPVRLRRPWLDPLPERLDLATLTGRLTGGDGAPETRGPVPVSTTLVLGLVDRPREQDQVAFAVDLADPSTTVFTGGPRSGRTSILRAAAICAATQLRADQVHIYAIDCAGDGLRSLADLPHCGAVVTQVAPTSITALLARLSREVDRRREAVDLPLGGAAIPVDPALLVLLDGWEGFLAAVEDVDAGRSVDTFLRLLRDGAAAGLCVLVTGDRSTLSARLSSAVQRRLVLRLSDPADYAVAGLARQQIPAAMPPGRAVDTADGSEIQLGMFGVDPGAEVQLEAVQRHVGAAVARERREPSDRPPFVIRALPARVRLDELTGGSRPGRVVVGVGGESAAMVSIPTGAADATAAGLRFLVAGPARSGRSTFLRTIMIQLARGGHPVAAAGGSRSPVVALARELGVLTVDPSDGQGSGIVEIRALATAGPTATLLIDDTELFSDGPVGEHLAALIRTSTTGLDVFASGRGDDLVLAFSGIAFEVKRARTGVLLQPGPGDGDLFGLRLPFHRSPGPPGRGLLVAPDLTSDLAPDHAGSGAIALQVAVS